MRQKSFIFIAALLVLLLAGAGGVYAYDRSNQDTIAAGVTVAGVDVGGLTSEQARAKVRRQVAAPLQRPVVVQRAGKRFRLSPEDANVRADVGGMVAEALEASREGNLVTRTYRDATGAEENEQVRVRVSYSEQAADALVKRVSQRVARPARDAELEFPSLERVSEQDGIEVRRAALARRVETALTSEDRSAEVPVKVVKAKVTKADLVEKYPTVLVLDRASFTLRHYENLELQKEYTVAIGAVGFDTPVGTYNIENKAIDPAWSVPNSDWAGSLAGTVVPGGVAENPLKARWMGIYDGAGIHGTDEVSTLGSAASHGCVRMSVPDVTELYDQVEVSTPIYIG
ncbi:MAG: L,D-transpeptidase family protein [Thermoleophilaceae bacterium]